MYMYVYMYMYMLVFIQAVCERQSVVWSVGSEAEL